MYGITCVYSTVVYEEVQLYIHVHSRRRKVWYMYYNVHVVHILDPPMHDDINMYIVHVYRYVYYTCACIPFTISTCIYLCGSSRSVGTAVTLSF